MMIFSLRLGIPVNWRFFKRDYDYRYLSIPALVLIDFVFLHVFTRDATVRNFCP